MSNNTQSSQVITLVMKNHTYEVFRSSALLGVISYPTHYQLSIYNGAQLENYIIDAEPFESEYSRDYGLNKDDATHRAVIAAALFRHLLEGGKTFKVLAKGAAAALLAE